MWVDCVAKSYVINMWKIEMETLGIQRSPEEWSQEGNQHFQRVEIYIYSNRVIQLGRMKPLQNVYCFFSFSLSLNIHKVSLAPTILKIMIYKLKSNCCLTLSFNHTCLKPEKVLLLCLLMHLMKRIIREFFVCYWWALLFGGGIHTCTTSLT